MRFTIKPQPVYSRTNGAHVATNFYVVDSIGDNGRPKMLTNWAFGTIDAAMDHADLLEAHWG
jgi:hypothetical protein